METQVIEDEQVGREERPDELSTVYVRALKIVGVAEAHGVSGGTAASGPEAEAADTVLGAHVGRTRAGRDGWR